MNNSATHPADEPYERNSLAKGLIAAIGNTPLIDLTDFAQLPPKTRLFAKLEGVNPGASVKDRPVARILTEALDNGLLPPGRRVLDSSSGNAGISYAMIGAALGIPVTIVVPGNASRERLERIAAHGAELIVTDPLEGYDVALAEAHRLAAERPERFWYADQYSNENNWRAHYAGTGGEILEQVVKETGAPADAFIAGIGTGGTITGAGRRLREANPGLHITAVRPERFPGIEGLKPLGEPKDIVPAIFDASLVDEYIPVTIEQAFDYCKQLALHGIFVGPSSGAYLHAATRVGSRGEHRTVVTILSDSGERYGSTGMWRRQAKR